MNTISFPKKGDPENDRTSGEGIEESIPPHYHEINVTDGGEFLDGAMRTKDQPLGETTVKGNE